MLTLALLWMIGQALQMTTGYWVIWWIAAVFTGIQVINGIYKAGKDAANKRDLQTGGDPEICQLQAKQQKRTVVY